MSGWPALAECGQTGPNEPAKALAIEVLPPEPTPRRQKRTKLGNVREIRAELARVYRKAKAGEIDSGTATRLAYLLDLMSRMIERSELEERVEALEAKAGR